MKETSTERSHWTLAAHWGPQISWWDWKEMWILVGKANKIFYIYSETNSSEWMRLRKFVKDGMES